MLLLKQFVKFNKESFSGICIRKFFCYECRCWWTQFNKETIMPEVTKFFTRAEFINTISETITNCTRVHKMSFNFQKMYRFQRLKLHLNNTTTRKCCIWNYWDYIFKFIKRKLFSMNTKKTSIIRNYYSTSKLL